MSAVAVLGCLIASRAAGFPLDDAWIHQDFARTLATTGQFAFQPGRSGAGSTSPLWVILLAPPQLIARGLALVPVLVIWSALLGACCLAALGIVTGVAARMVARASGMAESRVALAGLLAGVVTTTEWHLVWAAASGMETVLFALEALTLLVGAARGWHAAVLGLLAAATIATRPEGALAGGLVVVFSLWLALGDRREEAGGASKRSRQESTVRRVADWVRAWAAPFALALLVGLAPYAVLNLLATARPLPSTFFAKAAFYGTGSALGVVAGYVVQVAVQLLLSSPALLALGVLSYSQGLLSRARGRQATKAEGGWRDWRRIAAWAPGLRALVWAWPALLLAAYAIHLPVAYQHARYEMPALPPLIALASAGAAPLLLDLRRRLLAAVGGALVAALAVVSVVRAAQIASSNVRYIDDYQVRTALWLRDHTPRGALVATHDVGAIGFFSGRPIVDMAGLIDPQLVPLLSDQRALRDDLASRHVHYVVMFTDWFPAPAVLVNELKVDAVFTVRAPEFKGAPDSTFVVYRTGW